MSFCNATCGCSGARLAHECRFDPPCDKCRIQNNCYYCNEPLVSDDYKVRGVITSFSGQVCHMACFDKQNVADCFPSFGVDEETEGENENA